MERRKWLAVREYNSEVPKRPAYYEDHAKPAWISAPMMAVAAAALIIGGHFLSRRGGRRTGGDGGNHGGSASTGNPSSRDSTEPRDNFPVNLAQLRALRAEAAEARLAKESNSIASSSLTPLGSILMLARKVDKLGEECSAFLNSVGSSTDLSPTQQKELARLMELLTQLQLKIDGVKVCHLLQFLHEMKILSCILLKEVMKLCDPIARSRQHECSPFFQIWKRYQVEAGSNMANA